MITNEVSIHVSGTIFSQRILPRLEQLEQEEKLEELIKESLRDMGCHGDTAKAIIHLGARCIGEADDRLSALSIYRELQRIGF